MVKIPSITRWQKFPFISQLIDEKWYFFPGLSGFGSLFVTAGRKKRKKGLSYRDGQRAMFAPQSAQQNFGKCQIVNQIINQLSFNLIHEDYILHALKYQNSN